MLFSFILWKSSPSSRLGSKAIYFCIKPFLIVSLPLLHLPTSPLGSQNVSLHWSSLQVLFFLVPLLLHISPCINVIFALVSLQQCKLLEYRRNPDFRVKRLVCRSLSQIHWIAKGKLVKFSGLGFLIRRKGWQECFKILQSSNEVTVKVLCKITCWLLYNGRHGVLLICIPNLPLVPYV